MEVNRDSIASWLKELQDEICSALEQEDGKGKFETDLWDRPEGGGGRTRIIRGGNVVEKGGVLFSAVHGEAPSFLFTEQQHSGAVSKDSGRAGNQPQFFATGVSIVIHPHSPLVPIIHMNIRYFEMEDPNGAQTIRWLGGGIDLTPHYIDRDEARWFHQQLKAVCDQHHPGYYKKFSEWADNYFFIRHRNETRGIGGIFFDRLNEDETMSFEKNLAFWKSVGKAFAPVYTGLMRRNKSKAFTAAQKEFQLLRRGRYVEFNLVYDKGTKFGLETNGRVESILMSLPRYAGWEYDYQPEKGSEEENTLSLLKKGMSWLD